MLTNYNVGIYKNFQDLLQKNEYFHFLIGEYDYSLRKLRFKTLDELVEMYKEERDIKTILCNGKNINYIIVVLDVNAFDVYPVYKNMNDELEHMFFYPRTEDMELFDFIFDNHLVNFLSHTSTIKEYKWIKEKILDRSNGNFSTSKNNKRQIEYCFIGSSDPYPWESYLGHRVVKKHGHILLKKYKKQKIWVENEYVYME